MNPTLSIVACTRNRPEAFLRLLRSIEECTTVPFEVVVSDASDEPISTLGFPSNIRIIPERPRLGCTKGYNVAFREARGEFVIWLNDDCEVLLGYASEAISFMNRNPKIGLGALYYSEPSKNKPFRINFGWGLPYANFGILRRSLGEQVGWFDELLPFYGNDNSLTFRVLLAKKGVAGIPGACVIHHADQDAERAENQKHKAEASAILRKKYWPLMPQIRMNYERTRIKSTGPKFDMAVHAIYA